MERLHKFMSRHGVASRRACEEIIAGGRVKVNGKTVSTPGVLVEPGRDRVSVDGRLLKEPEKKIYIMINKPRGYLSTVRDPGGRKKVTDLLEGVSERVYPVGRLDYDSEGLLLLTNDGDFAFRMTHPGYGITKTYRVRVKGVPKERELEILERGVRLEDGVTSPAKVFFIDEREGNALLEISIREGRNRQIRRMMDALGYEVLRLKRIKVGSLALGNLKSGQFRHLTPREVESLFKSAGMRKNDAAGNKNKHTGRG
ncbi:MAG: pseudouridine synthase [Bacillota bacterium]